VTSRKTVAIIGSGPAGLTAARYLARAGYEVQIFDKMPLPGGLMMFAIPERRIPKARVKQQVEELEKLGVVINLQTKIQEGAGEELCDKFIRKRVALSELIQNFDAVLIATGAWRCRKLRIEGENLENVTTALRLIFEIRLRELGIIQQEPPLGRKVVVVGAGRTAADVVEELLLRDCEVVLVYRRRLEESRAYREFKDILRRFENRVRVLECSHPVKIVGSNGKVIGVEIAKVRLSEGKMIVDDSEKTFVDCDMVVEAIGEEPTPPFSPDVAERIGIKLVNGKIQVNQQYQTTNPKVFAAGDVVLGPSSIGDAVRTGLEAARGIDKYLRQS